jgi:hypothetical protein
MQDTFLKRVFLIDALSCFASFGLLAGFAKQLSAAFGLDAEFLAAAGWVLLPVAILFLWVARTGSRPLATLGAIGNLGWVAASFAVIPLLQPTPLGALFVAGQALAVLAITWFELKGLRRAPVRT